MTKRLPTSRLSSGGIYEAERLSAMPAADFREFTLKAYGATRSAAAGDGEHIHGWRNQLPIWVGEPRLDHQATARDVQDFANSMRRTPQYQQAHLRDGINARVGLSAPTPFTRLKNWQAGNPLIVQLRAFAAGCDRWHRLSRAHRRAIHGQGGLQRISHFHPAAPSGCRIPRQWRNAP